MAMLPGSRHALIILLVVLIGGAVAFYTGLLQFNHPSKREYPVRGIDVSHHQTHIGWFEASLNNVQFAYLKASEGTDFRDRQFVYNWQQCEKSTVARGAYHFFNFCRPGAAQARNFLAAVPPGGSALPPALDLEFSDNCKKLPSRTALIREISAFCKGISQRYPETPVFYVTPDFYKRYMEGHRGEFPPHRLWIRNVVREPNLAPCTEWTFWQYADHARVPGISGPVDLDVFCGSKQQFMEWVGERPSPR